jgi:hypothetical protein
MNVVTRLGLLTFAALVPALACAHPTVRPVVHLPYGLQVDVLDEGGEALPTADRGGRRYLLGEQGDRYVIRVTNPSARRVEVVVSVDGLDVIDGKPASLSKRGYVINPYGEVRIEGWRTSVHGVAAFRFGRVANSYAARTVGARNVGVIGVALFTAREPPRPVLPLLPRRGYYDQEHGGRGDAGGGAGAPPTAKQAPAPAAPPRTAAKSAPRAGAAESDGALARRRPAEERPGLGTEYGEHRSSSVSFTSFVRASAAPAAYTEMRYNDEPGLARLGIHFGPPCCDEDDTLLRESARPFPGNRAFAAPPPPREY